MNPSITVNTLIEFFLVGHFFKSLFPKIFLISTLNLKISRNMSKLCHKVCNGQNLSDKSPNFKHFQSGFFSQIIAFHFRLSKAYSIKQSLKNTLGQYIFESQKQEPIIWFEKYELNL